MINYVKRILNRIRSIVYKTPHEKQLDKWYQDNATKSLQFDYDLTSESIVVDLGGYKGQWASDLFSRYCCKVYIFEPMPDFANHLKTRFSRNPHIIVYDFGLGKETFKALLSVSGDGSSLLKKSKHSVKVQIVKASEFFQKNNLHSIDLIKINIEGGEYDLLEHLIEIDFIKNITNIQVQFHDFFPEAQQKMHQIQEKLKRTHRLTYQYLFIWENWQKLES